MLYLERNKAFDIPRSNEETLRRLFFSGEIEPIHLTVAVSAFLLQAEQSVTYHIKRIMNGYMPSLAADPDNLINAAAEERIRHLQIRERQIQRLLTNKITSL